MQKTETDPCPLQKTEAEEAKQEVTENREAVSGDGKKRSPEMDEQVAGDRWRSQRAMEGLGAMKQGLGASFFPPDREGFF